MSGKAGLQQQHGIYYAKPPAMETPEQVGGRNEKEAQHSQAFFASSGSAKLQ